MNTSVNQANYQLFWVAISLNHGSIIVLVYVRRNVSIIRNLFIEELVV